jgi:hypothetical protein
MIYSKKYPIPNTEKEFVLVEWERGYKNLAIFYNKKTIANIDSIQKIKAGFSFFHNSLGNIKLKFSENPIALDLIFNGLHSSVNNSHPIKKIKSIKNYFYMFGSLALFFSVLMSFMYNSKISLIFFAITEIPFIVVYFLCAFYSNKGKAWAVYLGFIVFSFFTLTSLISIVLPVNGLSIFLNLFIFAIKLVFIFLLIPYVKMANELKKYKKNIKISNQSIIDDSSYE